MVTWAQDNSNTIVIFTNFDSLAHFSTLPLSPLYLPVTAIFTYREVVCVFIVWLLGYTDGWYDGWYDDWYDVVYH